MNGTGNTFYNMNSETLLIVDSENLGNATRSSMIPTNFVDTLRNVLTKKWVLKFKRLGLLCLTIVLWDGCFFFCAVEETFVLVFS